MLHDRPARNLLAIAIAGLLLLGLLPGAPAGGAVRQPDAGAPGAAPDDGLEGDRSARSDADPHRLAGATRIETAVAISRAAFPEAADAVHLARADVAADALAAGALADGPVLLVPSCGPVPAAVAEEIRRLDPDEVVALGGPTAVCEDLLADAAAGRDAVRVAGDTRIDTAAAIARRAASPGTPAVFLASAAEGPDAVAAGSLTEGPVLLVPERGPVPAVVRDVIDALDPGVVVALGGATAVGPDVLLDAAAGRATDRLAGPGRIETAVAIAQRAFPQDAATAYLARADAFADAIAAGSLTDGPILLVPSCGALPAAVATELDRLGPDRVVALGGPAAICDALLAAASGGGPVPTGDPIAADLEAGLLTAEQALRHRVLRMVGDPRLPARYALPGGTADDSQVLVRAAEAFATLSPAGQAELAPYLVPPTHTVDDPVTTFAQVGGDPAACLGGEGQPPPVQAGWETTVTAHFAIHWPTAGDAFGAVRTAPEDVRRTAEWVALAAEEVYAAETALFGRHPLSDADQPCGGGDGAVDIYVARTSAGSGALTYAYPPGCEQRPAWITVAPDFARSPQLVRDVLAHEFAHVLQLGAYDLHAPCSDYDWLAEATATWAIDHVYPGDDLEHEDSPSFFREGHASSLWAGRTYGDGNGYEDWVFLLSLARAVGPDAIAAIWDQTEEDTSVDALEAAVPYGIEEEWHDFALRTWNREGVDDLLRWDSLDQRLDVPASSFPIPLGTTDLRARDQGVVPGMALDVRHYTVPDDGIRRIDFTGMGFGEGERAFGAVQAWIRLADGRVRTEDLTDSGALSFCRDVPDQDVVELALIYSNGLAEDRGDNLINFPTEAAEVVAAPTCGGSLVGTIEISEVVDVDHTVGGTRTTGTEQLEIVADLVLVPDPEGDGGQWIDAGASTFALSATQDTTAVREGQCTAHVTSTGGAGGAFLEDTVSLGVTGEPVGGDLPVVLGLGLVWTEEGTVRSDVPQCDEGAFEVAHTWFLGCPADAGLFGVEGELLTASPPRTVHIDCLDVVDGPVEGDVTTIQVSGTLREVR